MSLSYADIFCVPLRLILYSGSLGVLLLPMEGKLNLGKKIAALPFKKKFVFCFEFVEIF